MISTIKDNIISGAPLENIPECSISEYLYSTLKALPPKHVIQVDADSGATQTVEKILDDSIKVSRAISNLGLNKGDVVGLLARNSLEASVAVLGTWFAGAIIAPVNGLLKEAELEHAFKVMQPKILFCEDEVVAKVDGLIKSMGLSVKVVVVDKTTSGHLPMSQIMKKEKADKFTPPNTADPSFDVATYLPSSGTSGPPKEVGISHKSLIFQDFSLRAIKLFKEKKDCLQISHFFWVTGLLSFIKSLTTGMKRILLKTAQPSVVLKAIHKHKPYWALIAPALLIHLAECPDFHKYNISSLKVFMLGGSPFTPSVVEKLKGKLDHITYEQSFGTTELSGAVLYMEEGDIYSLGKACPGVKLKVADIKTGKALPPKEMGEIRVKTPGIMRCYKDNEEATKEAFDKEGWFCTGDLAYYNEQGFFYIAGRIKELIKVQNTQISPLEIETCILGLPGVLEVAVSGVSNDDQNNLLVALVVKKKDVSCSEKEIIAAVDKNLGDVKKLTGGVFFVDFLPKNANGKLQRGLIQAQAHTLCFGSSANTSK